MRLLLVSLCIVLFSGCSIRVKRLTAPGFEMEDGYIGTETGAETEGNKENAEY